MHEAGIVLHIVKKVEAIARENNVEKVDTLVLQVGELSGVVPHYIEDCYQVMINGTFLQETKLKMEIIPGGKDFLIKEIVVL